jgi:hypothetical protein
VHNLGHTKAAWFRSTTRHGIHEAKPTEEECLGDILMTSKGLTYKYVYLSLANSELDPEVLPYGYILSNPQTVHLTETGGCTVDIELPNGQSGKNRIYPPAAGWTNAMTDTYKAMFLVVTDCTDTTLIGQGGYILNLPIVGATSTVGWITLDRELTITADVTDLDFAVYDMPLHVVEPCGAATRTAEPVVVGASEVRTCVVDGTETGGVPDGYYFWMRSGPRGSLFHLWTSGATAAESCLKCSSTEGKAGPVVEGDELITGNITFAEAVTANAQQGAQLIIGKFTIGM